MKTELDKINELINKAKEKHGTLIHFNSELYYVYNETGLMLNCFKVKNAAKKQHRITINGAPYEACFDELIDIDSTSLYDICLTAYDEEIEYINNEMNNTTNKIKPGIIVFDNINKENYLVLKRNNNILYVIKIEDIRNERIDNIISIDIKQVQYVGTYDEYEYYELYTSINDSNKKDSTYLKELKKQD